MVASLIEDALTTSDFERLAGKVDLILTSPPFPLNRKKKYGNLQGDAFRDWLASLAGDLVRLLSPTGSIVIEMGNAWEPGRPVMSTLALESLLGFLRAGGLNLCQTFIAHNPSRLPTPAAWVNLERIRVKDSYTNVWWMAATDRPKADNRKVLREYSKSMKKLLTRGTYNHGRRPSGHNISPTSFLIDNQGAIPPNVIEVANTKSSDQYFTYCREQGIEYHPARMPEALVEFFAEFLTEPGDLILDPFAGSNTTGSVAEKLGRRWIGVEPNLEYRKGSLGRFQGQRIDIVESALVQGQAFG